jgi:hypothetical protein
VRREEATTCPEMRDIAAVFALLKREAEEGVG